MTIMTGLIKCLDKKNNEYTVKMCRWFYICIFKNTRRFAYVCKLHQVKLMFIYNHFQDVEVCVVFKIQI